MLAQKTTAFSAQAKKRWGNPILNNSEAILF